MASFARLSLLLLVLLPPARLAADAGPVLRLDSAQVVLDASPQPPDDTDPRWARVRLPDRWRDSRPEVGGFAWYRFEVPGPVEGDAPFALWLPQVNMNAAAFVNGTPVGSGGRFEEPVAHNFNRPLYFVVPAPLLGRARNTIDVRLYAIPHQYGALGPVELGPDALLRPRHERRALLQADLSQIATVLALLMTLVVGSFWVGTRFDPVYGLYALSGLFWSVASLNYWVRDIPVPTWAWERVIHAAIDWFAVTLALWAHRFTGTARPRLERALLVFGAVATLAIALLPVRSFYPTVNAFHALALAAGAYATFVVLRHLSQLRPLERLTYAAGGLLGVAFASHDLGVQLGWLAPGPHLLAYLLPITMLAFGTTLTGRFLRSLGAAERLNVELEGRVREKQAELERNFERLREVEEARVLSHERERIMREMHDGLGGRLVSTLSMVELGRGSPEEVASALRGALGDMRLVIDSLDPHVHALPELLGMLRSRLDPLLRASGLELVWEVGELPPMPSLGPEGYLHVLRIVQEAVTNAIKHAEARRLTLRTSIVGQRDPRVRIEIRDDGRGPGAAATSGGRGVGNMCERARQLGGEISVAAAAPGTVVALTLPTRAPSATPGS